MAFLTSRFSRLSGLVVIIGALVLIQMLYTPIKSVKNSGFMRWDSPQPTRTSLKTILDDEDAKYSLVLQDREELIRKWGPNPEDIRPFPTHGYIVWNFFIPSFRCPHRIDRLGSLDDGGKWFCGIERYAQQRAPCVIYSFGINGESSFEATVLKAAPHCEVWGYDFSVKSFGPEIQNNPSLRARAHFFPYALGGTDMPQNDPPVYTLQTLMQQNGHSFIDILKVDIEGAEFDSLTSFVNHFVPRDGPSDAVLPIGQLQLEIHMWDHNALFPVFKTWWENLERAGLRPFWTEPNLVYLLIIKGSMPDLAEYSFMNIRGQHALTDEQY